ncbi:PXMP2/4 family protein 2 isoform X3 [Manihot esculenta]|uniref:Uncharacterized protein n=1 Tax=Manihot esculenta TaxID=3983 RepID=A0A2C9W506_MANES|nr:PXMP2/4 family protein 2 isoform X3 [Manihot esculenta]OAY54285.1 hypothetical protein MANES_03G062700v8 [Manihot esculenta]
MGLCFKWQDDEKGVKINWKRVATTSLFGFGFVGPVGHFWYEGLDQFIRSRLLLRPNTLRFVTTKVAIDGLLFGPLDLLIFFTYMGFSTGKSVPQIKEDLKRDFLPALILEGGLWPVVQAVNFRFLPVRYQLLYVNIFCLLDSCFLSWIEQQEDAPWKQWFKAFQPFKDQKGQGG